MDSNTSGLQSQEFQVRKKRTSAQVIILRILGFILVVGLSVFIFSVRDQAARLAIYGYPGVFLITFMSYATVILPAPGLAIVFTMAGILNPLLVGLAAGLGAALGETVGYIAGYSGQVVVENRPQYEKIVQWMKKNAPLTIFSLAAIPNPFFDLAGIAAGMFRVPLRTFMFYCWLGVTLKMLIFAFLGAYSIGFLDKLF